MKYLISYDLAQKKWADYEKIIAEIKRFGGREILVSQWVVNLNNSAIQVVNHFKSFVDSNKDRLLVVGIHDDWASLNGKIDISKM